MIPAPQMAAEEPGSAPERSAPRPSIWLMAVMGLQIMAIVVLGVLTVARFPIWSPIDEGAHYAYIQQIAEHGSLPVLGKTRVSPQVDQITHRESPDRLFVDPFIRGLEPNSYEAFQPPLYYILATPVFLATPGYLDKVYALRAFDLALLLVAVGLALQLCRTVLGRKWVYAGPLVLCVFLLPGLIVRSVTVSNGALELPLGVLFLLLFCQTWSRPTTRRMVALAAVLGACLLTQLVLVVLIPLWIVCAWRWVHQGPKPTRLTSAIRTVAPVAAIPIVMTAPWFAFNEVHYHALTAGRLAMRMQNNVVNPYHYHFSLRYLPDDTVSRLWSLLLPQEWTTDFGVHVRPFVSWANDASGVILIFVVGTVILSTGWRAWQGMTLWLAAPYAFTVVMLWWISYHDQWFVILPRYTFPVLPAWVVAGSASVTTAEGRRLMLGLGCGLSVVLLAAWALLAHAYL